MGREVFHLEAARAFRLCGLGRWKNGLTSQELKVTFTGRMPVLRRRSYAMNADSTFTIGSSHQVCQDYAVAGLRNDRGLASQRNRLAYAVVSDGCSSSIDSDFGSRLLSKAAERLILSEDHAAPDDARLLHEAASLRALRLARKVGLDPTSVDATLLTQLPGRSTSISYRFHMGFRFIQPINTSLRG